MNNKDICHKCKQHNCKLFWCSVCKSTKYCSKECQRSDWADHKTKCSNNEGNTKKYAKFIQNLCQNNQKFLTFVMAYAYHFIVKYPKTIKNNKKYILIEIKDTEIEDKHSLHHCTIKCMDPEDNPDGYNSDDFKLIPNILNLDIRYLFTLNNEDKQFKVTSGINKDDCISAYNMMKDIVQVNADINGCELYVDDKDTILFE
jgi:MYND finger